MVISFELRTGHRNRLVRVVSEDCKRACSIKADATNGGGVDIMLGDGALD